MGDSELVSAVEKLRLTNKRLAVENDVWYKFLSKSEARLVHGMDRILHFASLIAPQAGAIPRLQSQMSVQAVGAVPRADSFSSLNSQISSMSRRRSSAMGSWLSSTAQTQWLNVAMKLELVKREKETADTAMATFMAKARVRRTNAKAQLEELTTHLSEIRDSRALFEQSIVREGIDPLTGRVPAEKCVRFLEEWLKSADSTIESLRMKTSTLHYKYMALKHQLGQKEELGESLHPVDFDQMKIENRILQDRIESKNLDLLQLKQKAGGVNLMLAKRKRHLQKQLADRRVVHDQMDEFARKSTQIEAERALVEADVHKTQDKLDHIRELVKHYTVPDLIDYVRVKKELNDLRKNVKVWSRRNHLQKIALDSCVKSMKRLTGQTEESPSWYQIKTKTEDDLSLE